MRNPKILRITDHPAGFRALAVYIESVCWSAEHLTDGLLPDWYRPTLTSNGHAIDLLVEVGLWLEVQQAFRMGMPGEENPPLARARWLITNYAEYGVTRAEWQEIRDQRQHASRSRWRPKPDLKLLSRQDDK